MLNNLILDNAGTAGYTSFCLTLNESVTFYSVNDYQQAEGQAHTFQSS